MVAESSCIRFFVDNGSVSSLQSDLRAKHQKRGMGNNFESIKGGYIYESSNHRSKRTDWSIHSR